MTVPIRRETTRKDATTRPNPEPGSGASACLATLVLAFATGMSLQSAAHFLPHPGDQTGLYLGV